jgi:hypothetical protein
MNVILADRWSTAKQKPRSSDRRCQLPGAEAARTLV